MGRQAGRQASRLAHVERGSSKWARIYFNRARFTGHNSLVVLVVVIVRSSSPAA